MGGMSESEFEYRQARCEQGVSCVDPVDLTRYLERVGMDAHSLRMGLADAVTHVFAGTAPPEEGTADFPYPQDRVERALFDDSMESTRKLLVADPAVAAALRHAMRLLADAADAAYLARTLLERPDTGAQMARLAGQDS